FILLAVGLSCVHAQETTIDPEVIINVFGTPPPTSHTTPPSTPPKGPETTLENITVKPTAGTVTNTNANGASCQCVPYYLCDENRIAVDANNVSVTGWNDLDIRFGEDDSPPPPCQESVEVCCQAPKDKPDVVRPAPDPTKLRGCGYRNPKGLGASVIGFERTVQDVYYHNDFKNKSLKNDIALLRLEEPLQLAEHINTLCLPSADESFEDAKNCVANGWGKSSFGLTGRYAVILKKVEQDMVPHDRCQALLQRTRLGSHFKLHSSFVCAGGEEGKDTCQLGGLVAWGIGCGMKDVPGVYTKVAAFRPWVDAKMRDWGFGTNTYTI
ncbi:Serine proteinase-like protein 2, partial [Operophtera brumata]